MVSQKQGILCINKPVGMTSHDVVDAARRALSIRQIGHAGTLDPLAEGLLILLVGKSTKLFDKFVGFDKEYLGVMKLGEVTATGDSQGQVIEKKDISLISQEQIKQACAKFVGDINQIPPMVSALRVNGKRLYRLARKGITVERQPRAIKIYSLDILKIDLPFVEFRTRCSKGTYIRQLAVDIGQVLGCGAHMVKIQRLGIGPFSLDQSINVEQINESFLQTPSF